jgi:hypothetical protein
MHCRMRNVITGKNSVTETLPDLLNKVEAIVKCGAGTFVELAKDIKEKPASVYDWIGQRRFTPNGDVTLRIQQWAAKKSNQIAMAGRKLQTAYRAAYREVCEKRLPVDGRN